MKNTDDYEYIGDELELFKHATNWKGYMLSILRPFIRGSVLEVGAGIGGTTQLLCTTGVSSWTALEPDPSLGVTFNENMANVELPVRVDLKACTIADLEPMPGFDCIIYIDVLEHIEEDKLELEMAARLLATDGRLVVLSPAHQFLYSPFDKAIGHFRRYSAQDLIALRPPGVGLELIRYLDMIGLCASSANKLLLKQSLPNARQLWVWDKIMVPVSKLVDPVFRYRFGKSVLAVWRKNN